MHGNPTLPPHADTIILGQGLAGSALAWTMYWAGHRVLIIDRDDDVTASKVAAGLVTPATGKRFVKSSEFDAKWPTALSFYRRVESETGQQFFEERRMLRTFEDYSAREAFFARTAESDREGITKWSGRLQHDENEVVGVEMSPAGRLNVRRYLSATKEFFSARRQFIVANVNVENQITAHGDHVVLEDVDVTAKQIVLCQGAIPSKLFPQVPNNPARGDILCVTIPRYVRPEVVHRSVWIAPNDDGTQSVGATYDWGNLSNEPSSQGRAEVLGKLGRLVSGEIAVADHVAAVRPTMKDYQPVIGPHPDHPHIFILNGLGSKGTLRAPMLAQTLLNAIDDAGTIPHEVSYSRLDNETETARRRPLTALAQELVSEAIQPGDHVIDATVGNGFDTCFLASSVAPAGRVIGYDVQQQAIESTSNRLSSQNIDNVDLRCQSHEQIREIERESISAIMFNLGYLPRGDHAVITEAATTISAVSASIDALKPGGVVTILCYRGHAGGPEEHAAVLDRLKSHEPDCEITTHESSPPKPKSPVLLVVRKRTAES